VSKPVPRRCGQSRDPLPRQDKRQHRDSTNKAPSGQVRPQNRRAQRRATLTMGFAPLGVAYAFLAAYPSLLTRVRTPGVARLVAILPGVAVCLLTPGLVAWVSFQGG
jgi:hypothetical protein